MVNLPPVVTLKPTTMMECLDFPPLTIICAVARLRNPLRKTPYGKRTRFVAGLPAVRKRQPRSEIIMSGPAIHLLRGSSIPYATRNAKGKTEVCADRARLIQMVLRISGPGI